MLVRALQACKPRVGTNMPEGGFADLPEAVARKAIDEGLVREATVEEWHDAQKAALAEAAPKAKGRPKRSAPKETTTTDE